MNFCKYRLPAGPSRGLICGVPLIATCDRSKSSKPTEFKGIEWTKKNPQKMMMYPEADEQENLCFWHQKQKDIKDGKRKTGFVDSQNKNN